MAGVPAAGTQHQLAGAEPSQPGASSSISGERGAGFGTEFVAASRPALAGVQLGDGPAGRLSRSWLQRWQKVDPRSRGFL